MTGNILIVQYFIWHENLPQPLFDKEGSFYDTLLVQRERLQELLAN